MPVGGPRAARMSAPLLDLSTSALCRSLIAGFETQVADTRPHGERVLTIELQCR